MTAHGERPRVFAQPPVVIGHRGAGRGEVAGRRENTIGSAQLAVEAGADWIEVDVRLCADGAFVLDHYPTAPDGRFFSEISGAEAEAQGRVPLERLLEWLPEGIGLDIDVKSSLEDAARAREHTTAARLAPYAAAEAEQRPVLVTSFDPAALLILREQAPAVPLGLITWLYFPLRKAIPAAVHLGCRAVVAHTGSFGPNDVDPAPVHRDPADLVSTAHEAGCEVVAWCPGAADATRLVAAGVDAVVADDVPGVVAALS